MGFPSLLLCFATPHVACKRGHKPQTGWPRDTDTPFQIKYESSNYNNVVFGVQSSTSLDVHAEIADADAMRAVL